MNLTMQQRQYILGKTFNPIDPFSALNRQFKKILMGGNRVQDGRAAMSGSDSYVASSDGHVLATDTEINTQVADATYGSSDDPPSGQGAIGLPVPTSTETVGVTTGGATPSSADNVLIAAFLVMTRWGSAGSGGTDTWRLRLDSVSGTIIASGTIVASTIMKRRWLFGVITDVSVASHVLVLTHQLTTGVHTSDSGHVGFFQGGTWMYADLNGSYVPSTHSNNQVCSGGLPQP